MIKCLECKKTYRGNTLLAKCPHCGNEDLTKFIRVDEDIDLSLNKRDREWLESRRI